MIHDFSTEKSLIQNYVRELRDIEIQEDSMRFRKNLERIGQCFAYEISKRLTYDELEVQTPMGIAEGMKPRHDIVLCPIMRAGIGMHHGFMEMMDFAGSAFVSSYRKHHSDGSFDVDLQYITCPPLDDKILILMDPMLATGSSFKSALDALLEYGTPREIHCVTAIASQDGIDYISRLFPDAHIWAAAVDEELTARWYIVPGLGDAGDLAYGIKSQE